MVEVAEDGTYANMRRFRFGTDPNYEKQFWLDLDWGRGLVGLWIPGSRSPIETMRYSADALLWELARTCPDPTLILDWLMEDETHPHIWEGIERYVMEPQA